MTLELVHLLQYLREGTLMYTELYDLILGRIYEYDQKLHALINIDIDANSIGYIFDDNSKRNHPNSARPLYGLPFSVKDTILTSGIVTTAGTDLMETSRQAEIVTILRALGGFVISKTNCPKFSLDIQTFNDILPPTNNPYAPELTSGGSSGGSAVSTAMGFDIFSVGTDLNGSLRIPAAFCHVCSIKPTEDILPVGGVLPPLKPVDVKRYNLTVGFIARRASDLSYIMESVLEYLNVKQEKKSGAPIIGITPFFEGVQTDNRIIFNIRNLRELLELNYKVCDINPAFDLKRLTKVQGVLANSYIHLDHEYLDHVNPNLLSSSEDVEWAVEEKRKIRKKVDDIFKAVDYWILPVTPTLPFPHNLNHSPILINGEYVNYWKATLPYCTPFSVSGHPVVTLPVTLINGLPFGVQIVGRYGRDLELLEFAKILDDKLDNKQFPTIFNEIFSEY